MVSGYLLALSQLIQKYNLNPGCLPLLDKLEKLIEETPETRYRVCSCLDMIFSHAGFYDVIVIESREMDRYIDDMLFNAMYYVFNLNNTVNDIQQEVWKHYTEFSKYKEEFVGAYEIYKSDRLKEDL